MRTGSVRTEEYLGYEINIYPDECPRNPREDDNLGTMLCKHRRYELGDVEESKVMTAEEIQEYVERKDVIALPLYLLDHSGLWLRTGRFQEDPTGWDTSMVGWITLTFKKAKKEYGVQKITEKFRAKMEQILENEVQTYSQYLNGEVYGFVIEKDGKRYDSCWGFYGDDIEKDMLPECRSIINSICQKDRQEAHILQNVTHA